MRILDNGTVRDATAEEIAAYEQWWRTTPPPSEIEAQADKAEAYDILTGGGGE